MLDKTDCLPTGAGLLARLIRPIVAAMVRLRARRAAYRPEKHYMRGTGPKSKRPSATASGSTPKAT
jgi:hypothetical protein